MSRGSRRTVTPTSKHNLAIVGSTASGKTSVAVELARRHRDIELVSIDAMAVYRGLDIGTAKPVASERDGIAWHLIDLVDPSDEFSVADFQQRFVGARREIAACGHRAIYVGGTGLYHRAAIDGLDLAGRFDDVAHALALRAARPGGLDALYAQLAEVDPLAAQRMNATNERRVLRALEVTLGSGRPFSSYGAGMSVYPPTDVVIIGLDIARDELSKRIERRLASQLDAGFLDEVANVLDRYGHLSKTASQALGYRELICHLEGDMSLEEACERVVTRTKRFAKRQEAWFRRDPRVIWVDALDDRLVDRLDEEFLQFEVHGTR